MTIIEAIKSGKRFRRKIYGPTGPYCGNLNWLKRDSISAFFVDDILADDWEIEDSPIKKANGIEKGSIYFDGYSWFVVVEQLDKELHCICDNANNIYSLELKDARLILNPKEAMRAYGWGIMNENLESIVKERPIPAEKIAEVLAGCHDDRFSHWTRPIRFTSYKNN